MAHNAPRVPTRSGALLRKEIYFVSVYVEFIFYELNSSHFPNFRDFRKNPVSSSRWTPVTPKNMKIHQSQNSTKFVSVTRFCEMKPTMRSVLHPRSRKFCRFSTCTILAIYYFAIFQKNSIFPGFYINPPPPPIPLKIISSPKFTHACTSKPHAYATVI